MSSNEMSDQKAGTGAVGGIAFLVIMIFLVMIAFINIKTVEHEHKAGVASVYKFVNKNGEGVIFIPQPKSKAKEEEVVIALVTAGGYEKVDVLPASASTGIVCTITPIQKSFNLNVECADPEYKFPVHKMYDATMRSSMGLVGFVDYAALPEFIDDLRVDLRKVI